MPITKTNLRMLDSGFITPLDFGATGDGVADDTVELQKALDSSYNVIDLAGKTYKITTQLTLRRSDVILRNGKIVYAGTERNLHSVLYIYGTTGSATAHVITADTKIGSNIITVGASAVVNFSVGDWVKIVGTTDITGAQGYYHGELHKIISVNTTGGTFKTLSTMVGNMKIAHGVTVQKMETVIENITIDNVIITGNGVVETTLADSITTELGQSTVVISHTGHPLNSADQIYIAQAVDTGGITAAQLTGEFTISSTTTDTYTITTTGTATSTVAGGGGSATVGIYGQNRGINAALLHNLKVLNCTINDCGYGIEADYLSTGSIAENIINGYGYPKSGRGISVYSFCSNIKISDNRIFSFSRGVRLGGSAGTTSNIYVCNNTMENIGYLGIYQTYATRNIIIKANKMTFCNRFTDGHIFSYGILTKGWGIEIYDNTLSGFSNYGIRCHLIHGYDVVYGDTTTSSTISTSYNPNPYITIKGNTFLGSQTVNPKYGIWIENGIVGEGHIVGNRISDNHIYGCHTSLAINNATEATASLPGLKDTIITGNILRATPDATRTVPQGIYCFNDSATVGQLKRSILSNNIFDTKAPVAVLGNSDFISFYDASPETWFDLSLSSFMGNIISSSLEITEPISAVKFATTTSDNNQTTERCCFIGNVFKNYCSVSNNNNTKYDLLQNKNAADKSLFVGQSSGGHSADTGAYWGLNSWGNTPSTTWSGTTS
jgi:hypothetical protein